MRAGILRTPILIYGKERRKTSSGFEKEEDILLYSPRAYIKVQKQSYDKDGVQGAEQFFGGTITFKVRAYSGLSKAKEVEYKSARYDIVQQQEQYDRTVLLVCKLKDL